MRDTRLYAEEMLEACGRALRYTSGMGKAEFLGDDRTFDAVVRCLTVIGEAAKGVPEDVRSRHPGIAWRASAGLRDRVVHHYFGIDPDVVWDVVENHLPPLRQALVDALEAWHEGDA